MTALALKTADIGISVENAVDIAKESADIILLEKNLLALISGVIRGREVFGNITKYIRMGASSNFGNALSILGSVNVSAFFAFAAHSNNYKLILFMTFLRLLYLLIMWIKNMF
ncbi:MAG: hypothetical protein MZU91_05945 [Desulfosudis oleivorans]|nr:hypothetical protein [Desulfosudis oleivorans]